MFFKGSRYERVKTRKHTDSKGNETPYKAMRVIPETPARKSHTVRGDERLDLIAQTYFSDPERFWRICDANAALWPDDLVDNPGDVIAIPATKD